jgi:hypothetical protein
MSSTLPENHDRSSSVRMLHVFEASFMGLDV